MGQISRAQLTWFPQLKLSEEVKSLITGCLKVNTEDRLTLADVVDHPWFSITSPPKPSRQTLPSKRILLPQFSHALEGHLRERLKFPVRLNEGTVELLQDVFLAKDGVRITPDQSRLLKLFGCAIADFNVKLVSKWEKKSSEHTIINALTAWDKRTYNAITVEGDDQRWEWLEDGKMHEMIKKVGKVDERMMEIDDENDNIASLF